MSTVHEIAAQNLCEKVLAKPGGVSLITSFVQGLKEGRWSTPYIDAIGQSFRGSPRTWDPAQIIAFMETHSRICRGAVAQCVIGIGKQPLRDNARIENQVILADLPHPFTAVVPEAQGHGDPDGLLEWSEAIICDVTTGEVETLPGGQTRIATEQRILPPGQAPLEIGTTLPSRTLLHMCDGGVARWPYRSETVRLFVNLEDPWSHIVAEHWEMRQRAKQETLW